MRLLKTLENIPTAHALWAEKWVQLGGPTAFNERLWYLGKIPFSNEVFKAAARDLKAALRGLNGQAKKVVILDLDETLWGGIVGETGWQGLILGGHDPAGEALVDFQRELKALTRRGILLAIVSKNEEAVAMKQLRSTRKWSSNWMTSPGGESIGKTRSKT